MSIYLFKERDVTEDKLDDAKFEIEGLKEVISKLKEYIEDRVWQESWGVRF